MLRSVVLFLTLIYSNSALSDEFIFADSHGPISVMGDHLHKKNEFMFSYRLSKMKMVHTGTAIVMSATTFWLKL